MDIGRVTSRVGGDLSVSFWQYLAIAPAARQATLHVLYNYLYKSGRGANCEHRGCEVALKLRRGPVAWWISGPSVCRRGAKKDAAVLSPAQFPPANAPLLIVCSALPWIEQPPISPLGI